MTKNSSISSSLPSKYPFDEGIDAAKRGISIHKNPYKSPNTPRTDSVRSEAWLSGFNSHKIGA